MLATLQLDNNYKLVFFTIKFLIENIIITLLA